MSGRRQFGSVRKLPSGRWQARYRLPGGQRVAAPTHFANKGDASRWLASVEAGLARGGWIDPAGGKVRLSEFADEWLRGRVNISKRTRRSTPSNSASTSCRRSARTSGPLAMCRSPASRQLSSAAGMPP